VALSSKLRGTLTNDFGFDCYAFPNRILADTVWRVWPLQPRGVQARPLRCVERLYQFLNDAELFLPLSNHSKNGAYSFMTPN
jgi:hypothetical protein